MTGRVCFAARRLPLVGLIVVAMFAASKADAQPLRFSESDEVPPQVDRIYAKGLQFLAKTQRSNGTWPDGSEPSAMAALGLMVFLASGEDPNFGPYADNTRRAVRYIISAQNSRTGYIGSSMYAHGFCMLALAEAYGAVDESGAVEGGASFKRSIGEALELAVRCAVTSQKKNRWKAWRYSPSDRSSADTSVAGAVLMGLLAARNAGIEVPDDSIDGALEYYRNSTAESGSVAYTGGLGGFGESLARSSIATLVYAIGKKQKWPQYQWALKYIVDNKDNEPSWHPFYARYYLAQALFQGSPPTWREWNQTLIEDLMERQAEDGSINSSMGKTYGTSMSLLALALNYKFLPIYER